MCTGGDLDVCDDIAAIITVCTKVHGDWRGCKTAPGLALPFCPLGWKKLVYAPDRMLIHAYEPKQAHGRADSRISRTSCCLSRIDGECLVCDKHVEGHPLLCLLFKSRRSALAYWHIDL